MGFHDIQWLRPPVGVSELGVRSIESSIGRRLPEDYREFLRLYGGGQPLFADFQFPDGDAEFHAGVGIFLGVDAEGNDDLTRVMRSTEFFPGDLVPITDDGGGNHLCLDYGESPHPRLVYWHHGRRGDPDEVSFVCRSFTEFGEMLKFVEDDE